MEALVWYTVTCAYRVAKIWMRRMTKCWKSLDHLMWKLETSLWNDGKFTKNSPVLTCGARHTLDVWAWGDGHVINYILFVVWTSGCEVGCSNRTLQEGFAVKEFRLFIFALRVIKSHHRSEQDPWPFDGPVLKAFLSRGNPSLITSRRCCKRW